MVDIKIFTIFFCLLKKKILTLSNKIIKMDKSYFIDEKTVVSKDNVLFRISDIVTIKDNKSPNYGKLLTILGFRWNKSETEICAITNIHTTTGIGIDKIHRIIDNENTPERISFYVKYTEEFTEDLYNALWEWSKKNSKFSPRGFADSYEGLKQNKFYIFDNWTFNCRGKYGGTSPYKFSYGVNNNPQNCEEEYSIEQIKKLIGYKEPNVEFIPGKWYKWYQKDHGNYHYGKVKRINTKTDTLVVIPWIMECTYYTYSRAFNLSKTEQIQEISIEEIQEFLPDSHSDKITSNEFKKGEYIVLIGNGQSKDDSSTVQTDSYIQNHCYKVRENDTFLRTELDSNGSTTNGWECIPYNPNKFHKTRNWRYATQKEIDEYKRRGGPYNVNELKKTSIFTEISQKELNTNEQVNFLPHLKNNKHKKILTINNIHSVDIQLKIKKKNVKF